MLEKSVHLCWLAVGLLKVKMQSVYITLAACTCSSVSERRHLKNSYSLWSLCLFPSIPYSSSHMRHFVFHCHPPKPASSLSMSILKHQEQQQQNPADRGLAQARSSHIFGCVNTRTKNLPQDFWLPFSTYLDTGVSRSCGRVISEVTNDSMVSEAFTFQSVNYTFSTQN